LKRREPFCNSLFSKENRLFRRVRKSEVLEAVGGPASRWQTCAGARVRRALPKNWTHAARPRYPFGKTEK